MSQEKTEGIYITQEDIDAALLAARRPETISDTDDARPLFLDESDIVDSGLEGDSEDADYFGLLSKEDIEALLHGDLDDGGDGADEPGGATSPETDLQGTGEVLSQDNLDRLLAGALDNDGEDVEPEFPKTVSVETEPGVPGDAESVPPGAEPLDEAESLISQSDLDRLLGGGPAPGGDSDAPAGGSRSTSEHISQDDINRLLKESLDEAEDLLGGEADPADENDFQDPVILAADEEPARPPAPDPKPAPAEKVRKTAGGGGWKRRIRSKRLVWAAAAGIVLFISIAVLMSSSEPTGTAPQPRVLTFSLNQTGGESSGVRVLSDTRVQLPGFVVLAPPNSAAVTYMAVDVTLDVSDTATVAVIKENEAFVRDIIYGTIRNELMTRDISAIDEISLELAIRKALGRIVAREAIGRIAFDRFSMM